MSLFRVFVDGQLFYHPHLSQLSIKEAKVQEDAENIDSLTLSAPFNHPYLSAIRPMASTIVCKKMISRYLRGGLWMMGQIFITPTHGHASPALRI